MNTTEKLDAILEKKAGEYLNWNVGSKLALSLPPLSLLTSVKKQTFDGFWSHE
jgi:hypothetical protein